MFSVDTLMVTEEECQEREYYYMKEHVAALSRSLEDYLLNNYMRQLSTVDREDICIWVEDF